MGGGLDPSLTLRVGMEWGLVALAIPTRSVSEGHRTHGVIGEVTPSLTDTL